MAQQLSSTTPTPETIWLRVRPCLTDPSKRIITTLLKNGQEEENPAAQNLWDEEQRAQRHMGIEKFFVHTYMMPPIDDEFGGGEKVLLIIEFVDSGHRFSYELNGGVASWCFKPLLGGIDYKGEKGNFYGFKSHSHDFFHDTLVPITLRIYKSLQALLVLRRPETMCEGQLHDHYNVRILLEPVHDQIDRVKQRVACTDLLVCGDTEVCWLFQLLSWTCDRDLILQRVNHKGYHVLDSKISYRRVSWDGINVEDLGWPKGYPIFLSTHEKGLQPTYN